MYVKLKFWAELKGFAVVIYKHNFDVNINVSV